MTLFKGTRRLKKLTIQGSDKKLLIYRGRQIYPCRGPLPLPQLMCRMTEDAVGHWLEVGFRSSELLAGNAADGWTDARGYVALRLERSETLQAGSWITGDFIDCDDSPEDLGTGFYEYWARCPTPATYTHVLVDFRLTSDRGEKEITAISLLGNNVALSGFPYAIPADASRLQADLRTAGFTGATVTSTAADYTVTARNHLQDTSKVLIIEQSGNSVTAVKEYVSGGPATISLPGYPYALPGDKDDLQADLRTAGQTGAVVMLHGAEWELFLPDVMIDGRNRNFFVTIDPGDPFPYWDIFGTYMGLAPANAETGAFENVRFQTGESTAEANKQFARMGMTRGTRVLP